MITNLFSSRTTDFLTHEMNICIEDLCKKISNDIPHKIVFFRNLFDFFIDLEPPYEYFHAGHPDNIENQQYINTELLKFIERYDIDIKTEEYLVFDSIRHAYISFKEGGILQLYKSREAEYWYPKVIIRKNLGVKRDIHSLDNKVCIYRGASRDEYDSRSFGQSWTLDESIADEFAFEHYLGQPNYQGTQRIVVKAIIKKDFIYYYDKNDSEQEVIIDERKISLDSLEIIEEKTLE